MASAKTKTHDAPLLEFTANKEPEKPAAKKTAKPKQQQAKLTQAVAVREEKATATVVNLNEPAAMVQVIERMAKDQSVDVVKFKALLDMKLQMDALAAKQAYANAMRSCQEELKPIATDANNPQTKSRYASYAALDAVIRPIYTRHGFNVEFDTGDAPSADTVRVVAIVSHTDGHESRKHLDMPADGKGAKGGDVMTKTHATGAALTYGRRYLLGMIFNLAIARDDDGNSASKKKGPPTLSEDEQIALRDLIEAVNADEGKFVAFKGYKTLDAIPASLYKECVADLRAFDERQKKAAKDAKVSSQ